MADVSFGSALKVINSDAKTKLVKIGEAVAVGDNLYQSGGSYMKCVNNDTLVKSTGTAIAVTAGAAADDYIVVALPGAEIEVSSAFTQGIAYYASNNAGKSAPIADLSSGRRMAVTGYGKSANVFIYNPVGVDTTIP